jgi:hypothetical protein
MNPDYVGTRRQSGVFLSDDAMRASDSAFLDLTLQPTQSPFANIDKELLNQVRPTTKIAFSDSDLVRPTVDKMLQAPSTSPVIG